MLPSEHLPNRVLLEKCGVIEFPLVREEDVDCIFRDQAKQARGEDSEGNGNDQGRDCIEPRPGGTLLFVLQNFGVQFRLGVHAPNLSDLSRW